jgi:recombination protein RecA
MTAVLHALRDRLARVVAPPALDALPTGLADLDAALGGGLPRGRMTELAGALGAGSATVARRVVAAVVGRGLGVAYVDAARTLDPADWAPLAADHLRVVRPPEAARGAWCADVLLRSGAFVLVVLDGAPPLTRQQALRLVGLARERDAAFLVVGERPTVLGGAVRLVARRRWGTTVVGRWASGQVGRGGGDGISLLVERGGAGHPVEFPAALDPPRRLALHAEGRDRRGTGRGPGKRWKGARNGGRPVTRARSAPVPPRTAPLAPVPARSTPPAR